MSGPAVTAVDVWKDRGVGIVEPLASLHAYDARTFQDALREAISMTDVPAVVVTFETAALVDVDILSVIQAENTAYAKRGGRIILVSVPVSVRRVLEISGLADLIGSYPSLEAALAALGPP
jgi:anti-anti-sigma factor